MAAEAKSGKGVCLLIIDPQLDFCEGGSLAVPGANADSERLGKWVGENSDSIKNITVSLDSHQLLHVGNALFWVDAEGNHPNPFTQITFDEVKDGKWKASRPEYQSHCLDYCRRLEEAECSFQDGAKFTVMVWPYHCIMGTAGHSIHPAVNEAIHAWAKATKRPIDYAFKGKNPLTEMYSVFKAEVVLGDGTYDGAFNKVLFDSVTSYDQIVVSGQAKSHCVNLSTRDMVLALPKDQRNRVSVLNDTTSPVTGFEEWANHFEAFLKENGCGIVETTSFKL